MNKQEILNKVCGNEAVRNAILTESDLNEAVSGGLLAIDKGGQSESNGCSKACYFSPIALAVSLPR